MKVLVAGWFSFEEMGATAGDLLASELVGEWLIEAGREYDVALGAPLVGGVHLDSVDPGNYDTLVFVCGPFGNGWPVGALLSQFSPCRRVGVDLSMLQPLDEWNPFDLLLERDSSLAANPDITFLSSPKKVPVIGVVKVHQQKEYGDRGRHVAADEAIDALVTSIEAAVVPIDTRLDKNETGLRSPAEAESLIARMDVVVTTRLHGLVLALKNGVPCLLIDPIAGGAKARRQACAVGWPAAYVADAIDPATLRTALSWCLTEEARARARACGAWAAARVAEIQRRFVAELRRV